MGDMENDMSEEVVLFVANDDGTITCVVCEKNFDPALAQPNEDDDPICPECVRQDEIRSSLGF